MFNTTTMPRDIPERLAMYLEDLARDDDRAARTDAWYEDYTGTDDDLLEMLWIETRSEGEHRDALALLRIWLPRLTEAAHRSQRDGWPAGALVALVRDGWTGD